ncbi:hypothetical protein SAMN02983003_1339 [Devosia enhydra]|uniref:Uncharacterized protein n=1 Tax=Devosia enhydra TaxID=665118 RepID=A0A1K2HVT6_9HYPH|nr:hypothetical protein [Devosia enhydra]SFZ82900.1 hypothetical protein SAMN02983003_1339 [Devosia enhydra]
MFITAAPDAPAPTITVSDPVATLPEGLPATAAGKLVALRRARDDARVLYEAAQSAVFAFRGPDSDLIPAERLVAEYEKLDLRQVTLAPLRMGRDGSPTEASEAAHAADAKKFDARRQEAYDRLDRLKTEYEAARALQAERGRQWQALNGLVAALERWLDKHTGRFAPVPLEPPAVFAGKPYGQGLSELRDLIAALTAERKRIERAPMSASEAKARIRPWVKMMADRVRLVGAIHHGVAIDLASAEPDPTLAYLCFLNPDAVVRRLEQEVDAQLQGRFTLGELDKARKLKELDGQLLNAERREEALIMIMAEVGTVVLRRPNADPKAVLGLA